jgi:hypothetical protein
MLILAQLICPGWIFLGMQKKTSVLISLLFTDNSCIWNITFAHYHLVNLLVSLYIYIYIYIYTQARNEGRDLAREGICMN